MWPGLRREHDSEVAWRESYAKTNGFESPSATPMGERARPRARLLGWRESYAKTNGFVASDPEICHSHGGTSPALARLFSGYFVRWPPRPPCAVIFCSLLTPLETYQSSLLGKNHSKRKRAIPTHLKVCEIQFRKMPTSEETTKVSCLWTGKFFHVHMSDLDWLLEFAFASHRKHGSKEVVGDPDGREAGGASAVAGASWRARWKVDPPTWEAVACSGPAVGVICSCRIDQFDKDKYAKVKESHDLSDHYAKLSKTRKKEAALLYLKDHMEAKGYVLSC